MPLATYTRRTVTVAASALVALVCAAPSADAASITFINVPTLTGTLQQEPNGGFPANTYQAYPTANNIAYGILAEVSGTIAGYPHIHAAAHLTDGYYGNGRSWIGDDSNSWFRLDFGSPVTMTSVAFGRDRLGYFDDREPGQFTIRVSSDGISYTTIVDSSLLGFSGSIEFGDTVLSTFDPVVARYLQMTFTEFGAAIDEVEVQGTPVPEPSTLALLGLGLAAIAARSRRRAA